MGRWFLLGVQCKSWVVYLPMSLCMLCSALWISLCYCYSKHSWKTPTNSPIRAKYGVYFDSSKHALYTNTWHDHDLSFVMAVLYAVSNHIQPHTHTHTHTYISTVRSIVFCVILSRLNISDDYMIRANSWIYSYPSRNYTPSSRLGGMMYLYGW